MMRGPFWGFGRRRVRLIPRRSAGKDCPTRGVVPSQPTKPEWNEDDVTGHRIPKIPTPSGIRWPV